MNKSSLPADDLPPKVTLRDELLLRRLEEAIGKHFYQACDRRIASFVIKLSLVF